MTQHSVATDSDGCTWNGGHGRWSERQTSFLCSWGPMSSASYSSVGIIIAISGNILISLALNIQKVAHNQRNATNGNGNGSGNGSGSGSGNGSINPSPNLSRVNSSESRPLLPRPASAPLPVQQSSYGATNLPKKIFALSPLKILSKPSHPPPILSPESPVDDHNSSDDDDDELDEQRGTESDYLRSKLWWLGFALMNVGEVGNFLSYAYAPASVVAPLGTVALVANCFFAPLMLGERLRKRDLLGVALAIIGAVTVVIASKVTDARLDKNGLLQAISQPIFIVYSIVTLIALTFLGLLSQGNAGRDWVFVDVGLCALFGGYTVLSTKGLSTLISIEWIHVFKIWITYPLLIVLIGTGVGQIRYLNRALMKFDSKTVIPTQFVLFNLAAIIGSAILYRDFEHVTVHKFITFLYGCAATFLGVFILTYTPAEQPAGTPLVVMDDPLANGPANQSHQAPAVIGAAVSIAGTNKIVLRTKASKANIGMSPGQYLLIAASPPAGDTPVRHPRDDFGSVRSRRRSLALEPDGSPSPATRRRTVQFENTPPR